MAKPLDVLVIGATGNQGGALARQLLAREHKVRALTRNPDKEAARALKDAGATIVQGDLKQPESIVKAAKGADVAFLVTTPYEDGPAAETSEGIGAVDALVKAGVPHLVYASVSDADKGTGVPHFDSKLSVERHLVDQDIGHTIVAPVFFRDNLLGPGFVDGLKAGRLSMAMPGDRPLQTVSINELGVFYGEIVERHDELDGQRIDIASSETTPAEMARSITEASGRTIEFQEVPVNELRKQNEDWALMFEWFDKTGYSADIEGLRTTYADVPWTDFDAWARAQDWAAAKVTAPART